MRITFPLLALLVAPAALAQTVAPAEPIASNPIPFNTQRVLGDGVPLTTTTTITTQAPVTIPAAVPVTVPAATPAAAGGMGLGKVFDEADINRDNIVTRAEFMAKAERHFGMADTNKDNQITRPEMQAQQNSVMQQMQQNLFGNGTLQNKINQYMGTGQVVAPAHVAPVVPVVRPPTPPTAPTTIRY